jgi:hypothetical protein
MEAKKIYKVMTLDDKIWILGKLGSGVCAVAAGMTSRWCFILKSNFSKIFNFAMTFYYITEIS